MPLIVKNWKRFQHYLHGRGQRPPWIKLHYELLMDFEFAQLPMVSQALLPRLWLVASQLPEFELPDKPECLAYMARWNVEDVKVGLKPLITGGFLIDSRDENQATLAGVYQDAIGEGERERELQKKSPLIPPLPDFRASEQGSSERGLRQDAAQRAAMQKTHGMAGFAMRPTPRKMRENARHGGVCHAPDPAQDAGKASIADARKAAIDYAFESFKANKKQPPAWSNKDYRLAANLFKIRRDLTIQEFQRRWTNFLGSTDGFTVQQGLSLGYFCANFDRFLAGPIANHALPKPSGRLIGKSGGYAEKKAANHTETPLGAEGIQNGG